MLKSLHHAATPSEMLPYKIVKNNKIVICLTNFKYYLHTILLWPVYYGNCRCHLKNNKKWCIWSLHLRNFLWLSIIALVLQKLCWLSCNYSNLIYIYIYLKIEIRNREIYSPEVIVSSTMGAEMPTRFFYSMPRYMFMSTLNRWFIDQQSVCPGEATYLIWSYYVLNCVSTLFIKQIAIIGWQAGCWPDVITL